MNIKIKIRKGDKVIVTVGKSKGTIGEVLKVLPNENKALVRGANMVKRHTKPSQNSAGGIIEKEAMINIANIAFIIGVTALIIPIVVAKQLIKKEFAMMIGVTLLGAFLISDGMLSRFDALMMFGALIFIMYFMVSSARAEKDKPTEVSDKPEISLKKSILITVLGMGFLVAFSKLLVFGAVNVATAFGVSELVIGLTIIAIGTSLPELAASLAAARKGCPDLAIGNVLGSNIFNILAVIGIASFISPFEVSQDVLSRDLPLLILLSFAFILVAFSPKGDGKINRFEGFSFLTIFIAYMVVLIGESLGWFNFTEFLFS